MLFGNAMCVCCRSREADIYHRQGGVGICGKCLSRLPRVGANLSFDASDNVDYVISPFYYKDGIRGALLDYKFNGASAYSKVFLSLMEDALADIKYALGEFDMIVPVPLSGKRMKERGYNQSALIAEPLAEFIGTEYCGDVLRRDKNTRRQAGLRNYERMTNVRGAFAASEDADGMNIIVFDDIYTTGATVEECAKTLKSAGAGKITAITLSITDRKLITPEARIF